MQKEAKEQLSAFIDGELSVEETRFLMRRMAVNPESREQLARYQRIASLTRNEHTPGADSLADRVRDAIANEALHNGAARRLPALARPLGGMAIAASVALALVLSWPALFTSNPVESTSVASNAATTTVQPASGNVMVTDGRLQLASQPNGSMDADVRHRLNPYLVNHSEHAALGQLGGTLKYARIVSHDADR